MQEKCDNKMNVSAYFYNPAGFEYTWTSTPEHMDIQIKSNSLCVEMRWALEVI